MWKHPWASIIEIIKILTSHEPPIESWVYKDNKVAPRNHVLHIIKFEMLQQICMHGVHLID
jgi:hypothetical protein